MDGFVCRIWAKNGIDKVVMVNKGIFMIRFHIEEQRDKILMEGFHFFDRKPLIMKNGIRTWTFRRRN